MRLLLAMLMVWTAPFGALAQLDQPNFNPQGYACNGRDKVCSTYAFYRTFQSDETLAKVAGYFNVTPASVAKLSGLEPNATARFPEGQPLYIPLLDCRCGTATSQMKVPHTIAKGDSFYKIARTLYDGLTTPGAMMTANSAMDVYNLVINDTAAVPIFCACPTAEQIANGVEFLLTYGIHDNEPLDFISANFDITAAELSAANHLPVDATLENYTNVLVPLQSLPPLTAMNFPYVMPPIAISTSTSSASSRYKMRIIAGTSAGAVVVLLVVVCLLWTRRRRWLKKDSGERTSTYGMSLVDPDLPLRMFTYKEIKKATKSFRKSELLGSGGFGTVYRGRLPSGALVAVKRMRMESKHGKESFRAEVKSLSRIRHRNLVQLRGWCHEEEHLLLVYDYMCNGSLDEWLFKFSEKGKVLWEVDGLPLKYRRSILSGVASALAYLHEECPQCVLHRDIKSSNVLLDADMNAYLGDFGLARLIDHQKMARTTMMAGTLGYLAPEMSHTGKATRETDVYSFGVLMLEVMCGRLPLDVVAIEKGEGLLEDMVWRAHEAGKILQAKDSKLGTFSFNSDANSSSNFAGVDSTSEVLTSGEIVDRSEIEVAQDCELEERKMITNLLQLGLLCCHPSPEARPTMRVVSQLMQCKSWEDMEMAMPCLPEWKPQVLYSRRPGFRGFSQVLDGYENIV